jgi:cobalt-zinc-cadmium efflux system membrane fusion protein
MHAERPFKISSVAVCAAIAALCVQLCACSPKPEAEAKPIAPDGSVILTPAQRLHIQIMTVGEGAFHKAVDAPGVVDFDNDQATSVIAPFSGPVTRLLVNPGDHVHKGQPLAYVASADFSAAVGAYSKAEAAARNARRIAETDKDLLQHNGVSAKEAQQAESDALGAEADRDAALKALTALDVDPGAIRALQQGRAAARVEGVIRAPISGTVAEKLITPGQLLQAGTTPCFTVADLSKVWVMTQVAESDLTTIKLGDAATIQGNAAANPFIGVVQNISAVVNPDTRTVQARVVVNNPGVLLKKQMYVRVQIQSRDPSSGLMVPVSAVLHDDQNLPFVYVQQPNGNFGRRHVTLGQRSGDQYQITEGLTAGEHVVVDGGIFLQFMQSQ